MLWKFVIASLFFLTLLQKVNLSDVEQRINVTACNLAEKVDNGSISSLPSSLEKYETALVMLVAFGGFSLFLAGCYKILRRFVFHDSDNLDTIFDAGGNVSFSLTAVTVASQLLWPADLLQSSTVTVQLGIAAPFWYTVGAVSNMLLFPILSVKFKVVAPGAKTYLQLMLARHGSKVHIWFCFLALLLNFVIISCLLVSSRASVQALTKDASIEFVCIILAVLFGSYSFVGGLGTTFYVSYFNALLITVLLVILITTILFSSNTGLGSMHEMFDVLSCIEGPTGNYDRSLITFRSLESFMWALIGICVTASLTYCDQASWQSRIAAKPTNGVLGFLVASAIWFSIPSALGTTAGMAYLVMSQKNGTHLLTTNEIETGLVAPFVTEKLFGKAGAFMVLTMNTMALMSTGSGEVMAAASIIVYDIYQSHINPFRPDIPNGYCKFCQLHIPDDSSLKNPDVQHCSCPLPDNCLDCKADFAEGLTNNSVKVYKCNLHASLRSYQNNLIRYKSWCIIWLTIAIVPLGLAVLKAELTLHWTLLYGCMMSVNGFPGVLLSVLWYKSSRRAVLYGSICGLISTIVLNLIMASRNEDGLNNFFGNTVDLTTVMVTAGGALMVNFAIIVIVSLIDNRRMTPKHSDVEWKKTHNIDNPLYPWSARYLDDIPGLNPGQRPTVQQLNDYSQQARRQAFVGSGVFLLIFMVIIPVIMVSFPVLSYYQFRGWVLFCMSFTFVMAGITIILAPLQEAWQIIKRIRVNKKRLHSRSYKRNRVTHNSNPDTEITLKDLRTDDAIKIIS